MNDFTRKRVSLVFLLVLWLAFSLAPRAFAADEVEAVHDLFNRVEQAWVAHDLAALEQCISDQGFLGVVSRPGDSAGPWVADKKTMLAALDKAWTPVKNHRLVDRRIGVSFGMAAAQLTSVMELVDGDRHEMGAWDFAVKEGSQWRLCFSMPDIASLAVLVDDLPADSSAARAGLRNGDVILHCDGRLVTDGSFYGWTTPPGPRTIAVRRGTADLDIKTEGGPLGVKPRLRWLPGQGSEVIRADQPHPIKDLWGEWYRASVADDRARVAALGYPAGVLGMCVKSHDVAKVLCGDALHASFQENWKVAAKEFDPAASTLKDISLIQRGGIALGTCFMDWKLRSDGNRRVTGPVETTIFVRQGDSWHLLAVLPINYDAAIGLPGDSAGNSGIASAPEAASNGPSDRAGGARRTWTDITGKHHMEAEFFGLDGGTVRLKKSDGTVISVPLDRLSDGDREYVKKLK